MAALNSRSRIQAWHPESEFRALLAAVKAILDHPRVERNILMALQADVQRLVDEVKENNDLVKSIEAALTLESTQITDLQAKIDALTAGQVLTAEDLTAIQDAAKALGETNDELKAAVPANTTPAP